MICASLLCVDMLNDGKTLLSYLFLPKVCFWRMKSRVLLWGIVFFSLCWELQSCDHLGKRLGLHQAEFPEPAEDPESPRGLPVWPLLQELGEQWDLDRIPVAAPSKLCSQGKRGCESCTLLCPSPKPGRADLILQEQHFVISCLFAWSLCKAEQSLGTYTRKN